MRNRVAPTGEIVDSPQRGSLMGNRGCLHEGREIVRPWRSRAWITCRLEYKGWRMPQWAPGRYTVLFFPDEAVALAAGHRPCALCRRADFERYVDAWAEATGRRPRAAELDGVLHDDRLDGRTQRTITVPWAELPDGAFVSHDGAPALVWGEEVWPWSVAAGYALTPLARPDRGTATVLTPAGTLRVLAAGYRPEVALPG